MAIWEEWHAQRGHESSPFPLPCLMHLFHLAIPKLSFFFKYIYNKLITKKVGNVGEGQNQGSSVKELFHQFPEEPLLKCILSITNLGPVSLVLNAAEWKRMFELIQDP